MFTQQSTIFPKQIKISDYEPYQNNHLIILQSSNLLLGSGSRTSTSAIVLVKCLHNLIDQSQLIIKNKKILQLGSGTGLIGIYLAALGAKVTMTDNVVLKDLIQKNININRNIIKEKQGEIQFNVMSWKNNNNMNGLNNKMNQISKMKIQQQQNKQMKQIKQQQKQTKQLLPAIQLAQYSLTIACQCGGLSDLQHQLNFISKQGMIIGFMRHQNYDHDDGLNQRQLQQYLTHQSYDYQIIQNYHPDYVDNRICIMKIYPKNWINNQQHQKQIDYDKEILTNVDKLNINQDQEQEQ